MMRFDILCRLGLKTTLTRKPRLWLGITWHTVVFLSLGLALDATSAEPTVDETFDRVVSPFLKKHCLECHSGKEAEGEFNITPVVDALPSSGQPAGNVPRDVLAKIRDQLRDGLMPPPDSARPPEADLRRVVATLTELVGTQPARLPNQGNLVPHELLFGVPATTRGATPARVWRLSPDAYKGFVREVHRGRADGIVQPFTLLPERGIKDFAALFSIDEPSTEILLRNAELIVEGQTAHELKDGKVRNKHDTVGEFVKLMDPAIEPTRPQLETAVRLQFRLAIGRQPDAAEIERFVKLYEICAADGDRPAAVKTMLQAVLLRTDAMYRSELGDSSDSAERRMLAPAEIVRAVSLALCDRRDAALAQAAEKGELTTPAQIATHVRRLLDDPKVEKPGLLRFFREYFEYHRAVDVFKDQPTDGFHEPSLYVSDTDRLVQHILAQDRDVLRELLTTTKSFVNVRIDKNRSDKPQQAHVVNLNHKSHVGKAPIEQVYGVEQWSPDQPMTLPAEKRIGVLMQPSWLAAFSTNFDNDPVRRGRWIRERLLGGTVPDLPIGVAAQVPDEKHRTFRDRLQVTRDENCWKCHQRMDELGLPFENFDHYGRFRTTEKVLDPEATERNVDKKGKQLGPVHREAPLDTTGRIANSGDQRLDGPVQDPRELVRRLADSERVRQVFVRHAFRFFLGRNESLSDARALQDADRAYVESQGSFKALVVSLLTSDSFLLRQTPVSEASP